MTVQFFDWYGKLGGHWSFGYSHGSRNTGLTNPANVIPNQVHTTRWHAAFVRSGSTSISTIHDFSSGKHIRPSDVFECVTITVSILLWPASGAHVPVRGYSAFGCVRPDGTGDEGELQCENLTRLEIKTSVDLENFFEDHLHETFPRFGQGQ